MGFKARTRGSKEGRPVSQAVAGTMKRGRESIRASGSGYLP